MTARTHLFVVPGSAALGEILLGRRLARELVGAGDRVLFLRPAALAVALAGEGFAEGSIDPILAVLDRALPDVIRDRGADTVILCDLLTTLLSCGQHRIDPRFLDGLPVPVVALDIWDLANGSLTFDMGDAVLELPLLSRTVVARRLVPVPFARPGTKGAYCALPAISAPPEAERARTRAAHGFSGNNRLVALTTARFQKRGLTPFQRRATALVGPHLARLCTAIDPRVEVIHVGPEPLIGVGPRVHHRPTLPPVEFERLLAACDLLVTPNQAATSISTALALGVPALAAVSGGVDVPAELLPAFPFRILPLGLHGFMAPLLEENPYTHAVPALDLFAGDALAAAIHGILFEAGERSAFLARQEAYVFEIKRLPSATAWLRELLYG